MSEILARDFLERKIVADLSRISKYYFLTGDVDEQEMYLRWWSSSIKLAGHQMSDPAPIENDADDFRGREHENKNSFWLLMCGLLLGIGLMKERIGSLASPTGLEPVIYDLEGRCIVQLC